MKRGLFKKSGFFLTFFVIFSSLLLAPSHENFSHRGHAAAIEKCAPSLNTNNLVSTRNCIEAFLKASFQILADFSTPFNFQSYFKKKPLEFSLNDLSYNHHFRTILSSRAHPPTILSLF